MHNHREPVKTWCIYDSPADYPGFFVARLFHNATPTGKVIYAKELDKVRALLPFGLYRMPRDEHDDRNIIEIWI